MTTREPTITQQEEQRRTAFSEQYAVWADLGVSKERGFWERNSVFIWGTVFPLFCVILFLVGAFVLTEAFKRPEVREFMYWVDDALGRRT